ncbi:MAG TPA: DUF2167 domain-containing protein [Bryobacteraceae bacterium]|nr:DUF2167 domain-containing protein [Bryobacteraceae bacterium]
MKAWKTRMAALAFCSAVLFAQGGKAKQDARKEDGDKASSIDSIQWVKGPATGKLKDQATVEVPKDYVFADDAGTRKFLEITENIPTGREYGMLAPKSLDWFAIYEFSDSGYVKDDEKGELDAGALLKSLQDGTERSNEERKRRGWETLQVIGWKQAPRFNDKTKNLEWATEARSSSGGTSVNHNVRILGRRGYMSVTLVGDNDAYAAQLVSFNGTMQSFQYSSDNVYAAFRSGDKVAEYGLTALIVGGAAAVATKTGFLKSFWKLIVMAVLGAGAFLKRLFTGKKDEESGDESRLAE